MITLLAAAIAHAAPARMVRRIQSPLFEAPAFALKGGTFTIKLTTEKGSEFLSAYLEPATGGATQIKLETTPGKDEPGLLVLTAAVPKNTPPALYNLQVEFNNERGDIQPHSVAVIDSYKANFDFIHLTDIHFNIQYMKGRDMNLVRRALMKKVNSLKPEFIIFTGDLGLDPENYDSDYIDAYEDMLHGINAPMFMSPGNHEQYYTKQGAQEIDGRDYWLATYGPDRFSFDYGKMHFIGFNTFDFPRKWRDRRDKDAAFSGTLLNSYIGKEQMEWITADLAASRSAGKYCVAATHIPLEYLMGGGRKVGLPPKQDKLDGPTTAQFADLLNNQGCAYLLVGHMHFNQEKKFGALTQLLTMSSGTENGGAPYRWGWRVIHVKNGKISSTEVQSIGLDDVQQAQTPARKPKKASK